MTAMPWREGWEGEPVKRNQGFNPFALWFLMVGLTFIAFANAGRL
jgi:hypothetical protein